MVPPLDVFSVKSGGVSNWLGAAETLDYAMALIRKTGPGSYLVFSHQTGHKNFFDVSSDGVISARAIAP